ncbi:MAG: nodulation protein NfeD [Actinobacteria bacterium]|nr:nodulation protein NfeD [Actinomycetota bacterium]
MSLDGVVDPFEASYLASSIEAAEEQEAAAVLITIDTPGGLDSSMRKIIQSILNSEVPIICYVSPAGARAASAGAFILLSCDLAVMAPGTNVGAASPVGVSGAIEQEKVLNDAAAFIRSLAQQKDRNPDWAERAVREAASASAEEALELDVIDSIEPSVEAVLANADGRTVQKNGQTLTLQTADASVVERSMGAGSSFLHGLLSPDFAFLFFYLGIGLIIFEVLHPGISVPGILGVLSLVAAFAGFGTLPVQLIGIILLLASAGLFLLELKLPGISVAGISAVVTLVGGGLLLFDPAFPDVRVSIWVLVPVAATMGAFFFVVAPAALRARRLPVTTGVERLIGTEGVVVADLNPSGTARVGAELWTAESISGTVKQGELVRVVAAEGLRLRVVPVGSTEEKDLTESAGGRS